LATIAKPTGEQAAMPIEIRMPELAPDITEADLIAWLVEPGSPVDQGEAIVEIETEKSTVEIEAPASGILSEILVPQGSLGVAVGTVLGVIEAAATRAQPTNTEASGPEPPQNEPSRPVEPKEAPSPAAETSAEPAPPPSPEPSNRSTALARRLAQRAGLDIDSMRGSGGHGRVTKADVQRGVRSGDSGAGDAVPSLRLEADCQADRLMETLRQLGAGVPDNPIPIETVVLRAAALALRSLSAGEEGPETEGNSVEIDVTHAASDGRSTRIRDADRKGLAALSLELNALDGAQVSEARGHAGLQLTGLDTQGVDRHWPGSALGSAPSLGFGPPRRMPVVRAGSVAPGYVLTLTLSADPRWVQAEEAARLLAAIRGFIEAPLKMVL